MKRETHNVDMLDVESLSPPSKLFSYTDFKLTTLLTSGTVRVVIARFGRARRKPEKMVFQHLLNGMHTKKHQFIGMRFPRSKRNLGHLNDCGTEHHPRIIRPKRVRKGIRSYCNKILIPREERSWKSQAF